MTDIEQTMKRNFIIAICGSNLFINACISVVGPFFPIIAKEIGVPIHVIGYIFR